MHYRRDTGQQISHLLTVPVFFLALLMIPAAVGFAQTKASKVDLNTASEKELESIKGVGPATANRIMAGRPYNSVDDLSKAGIPAKTVESIKPFVTVSKPAAAQSTTTKTAPAPSTSAPASPPPGASTPQKAGKAAGEQAGKLPQGQKVNLNTATKEQLEALPGIGPVKAQAIIDGRPYKKPEDVMKVKGIKEGTFNKIKDSITTG